MPSRLMRLVVAGFVFRGIADVRGVQRRNRAARDREERAKYELEQAIRKPVGTSAQLRHDMDQAKRKWVVYWP